MRVPQGTYCSVQLRLAISQKIFWVLKIHKKRLVPYLKPIRIRLNCEKGELLPYALEPLFLNSFNMLSSKISTGLKMSTI